MGASTPSLEELSLVRRDSTRHVARGDLIEIGEAEDSSCRPVVLRDFGVGNRPAAVRHPIALFEIDRVQGHAAARPQVAAAAEVARAGHVVRTWRIADDVKVIQRLGVGIRCESAAFHEADVASGGQ